MENENPKPIVHIGHDGDQSADDATIHVDGGEDNTFEGGTVYGKPTALKITRGRGYKFIGQTFIGGGPAPEEKDKE